MAISKMTEIGRITIAEPVFVEALKEIELSDLKRGAGNGKSVYVRIMSCIDEPVWVKVYIYQIGSKYFVDAQPISDEEVLKRGSAVQEV